MTVKRTSWGCLEATGPGFPRSLQNLETPEPRGGGAKEEEADAVRWVTPQLPSLSDFSSVSIFVQNLFGTVCGCLMFIKHRFMSAKQKALLFSMSCNFLNPTVKFDLQTWKLKPGGSCVSMATIPPSTQQTSKQTDLQKHDVCFLDISVERFIVTNIFLQNRCEI